MPALRLFLALTLLAVSGCGNSRASLPSAASLRPGDRTQPIAAPRTKAAAQPAAQGIFNQPVVIDAWLNGTLARYDHNRSGQIDFKRTGWFASDERERQEAVRTVERDEQGQVVRIRYTIYTYTLRDFFYAGDRNADQAATRDELTKVVARFDGDQNGELTRRGLWGLVTFKPKGEWDRFRDAYKERVADVEYRDVDVNDRAGQIAAEREAPVVSAPTLEVD